jgi:hypothetical protein
MNTRDLFKKLANKKGTKKKFDKRDQPRVFNEGDLVLQWDKQHE